MTAIRSLALDWRTRAVLGGLLLGVAVSCAVVIAVLAARPHGGSSAPQQFAPCPSGEYYAQVPDGQWGCLDTNGRWPG